MKIKLIFLLFFLGLSFCLMAQEQEKKLSLGIKAGGNYSMYLGTEDLGVYGGVQLQTRLGRRLYLQNELLVSSTDDIYFLEIPILLKYKFSEKLYGLGGIKGSLPLNNQEKYNEKEFESYGGYEGYDYFLTDFYGFKSSIVVGVQHYISKKFFIEGNFSFGLFKNMSEIYHVNSTGYREYSETRIHTAKAGIGYTF